MAKDTFFQIKTTLNAGGRIIDLSVPQVMGILNITPDSFFAESRTSESTQLVEKAGKMLEEGALFLDMGAYSSRPGAADVSEEEEVKRLIPAVQLIAKEFPSAIISVDTFRAKVAEKAIQAGAHIINDISGGELDAEMFETVGNLQVPYILMHMRGNPETMSSLTNYDNLMTEITHYFSNKINCLKNLGVKDIILDPGFGFAKTIEQNFQMLKNFQLFQTLGFPMLAGLSRKRMVWKTLNTTPEEALNGTTVLNVLALQNGASVLRVHDVKAAVECIKLLDFYHQQ